MLIRQALQPDGQELAGLKAAIARVAGTGHDPEGHTDVARRHDDYLYGP